MSELTPQIADQVVAACRANAGEAAAALGRALDTDLAITVGEPGQFVAEALPSERGLAILFVFGNVGFAVILNETSGLLPTWYESPDPTGQGKLSTLAQELSMQLVPDSLLVDSFQAQAVGDVRNAVARAGATTEAVMLPLELKAGERTAKLQLVWPLASPGELFDQAKPAETASAVPPVSKRVQRPLGLAELPSYTRSLLKITVPVRVVLAEKKESVQDVVELAPGTIIKFSKSCEETLHLFVGDQQVAEGEAVKVGDKFGFRVTQMTLPEEHFLKLRPKQAS